ncbi:MAG: YfhO family protein [Alistipes sp.]|nr:YfhO family protein [Alistipes sp.]
MEQAGCNNNICNKGWIGRLMDLAPWVVGVLIFWMVSHHFYAPQFEGRSLSQGDIAQYAGMSEDIREHRAVEGEDPQWTGNMFSGMPAYLIDVEYPAQYVKRWVGSVVKAVESPMNMTLCAMVLMMVAVVMMGVNPWIGIIAGLAYGLSTYFFLIIDAGHITKMWALVYAPPMVAAVWYALRRNMWVGAAFAALFGSLELGANHPQITYYFLLVCLALWISEIWFTAKARVWGEFIHRTLLLVVAALLAVGSNFSPLWYTLEHQKYTTRGVAEAKAEGDARAEKIAYNTAWSYGIGESFNMLVPSYMGAWSGDVSDEVIEVLQSPGVQSAIVDDAIDELTRTLQQDIPELQRADVEYFINAGDENLAAELKYIYEARFDELAGYASNYWGTQPYTAGPTYLGAVVVMLAILGLVLVPSRGRWWMLGVMLFALLLAWGGNFMGFYEVMYDLLPGYKSFRTVSMALVIIEWGAPLMAAVALWQLLRSDLAPRGLYVRVGVAYVTVVVLVVAMAIAADYGLADIYDKYGDALWVEQLREAAYNSRHAAMMSDLWRTLGYVTVTAAVLVGYVALRGKFSRAKEEGAKCLGRESLLGAAMVAIVGGLVVVDLMGVADRYMYEDKWVETRPMELTPTAADRAIMADTDLGFRVLDLSTDPFNSARASYFHRSVGGYHGAKLGRYQEVIDRYLSEFNPEVLAALNTRYVIYGGEAMPAASVTGVEPYGAAWFVSGVERRATAREELEALGSVALDSVAVVAESVKGLEAEYDASGVIELVEYAPNRLKYEYEAPSEALCLFSEIYFPEGWSVTIDGREADYFAADYILRGMELPAGKHTVEWSFRAPAWRATSAVMGIASALILAGCVAVAVLAILNNRKRR